MTLNQVIQRLTDIAESHQQIRTFFFGLPTDFLNDKTDVFPSVVAQDTGGNISLSGNEYNISFRLFFLDLVNVVNETKDNELEVQSDMLTVAKGFVALMNRGSYTDWAVSSASFQLLREELNDMTGGVFVDVTIRVQWDKSYCEEPIL